MSGTDIDVDCVSETDVDCVLAIVLGGSSVVVSIDSLVPVVCMIDSVVVAVSSVSMLGVGVCRVLAIVVERGSVFVTGSSVLVPGWAVVLSEIVAI